MMRKFGREKPLKKKDDDSRGERRQYIRLNAVFPVEFQFLDPETGGSVSDIKQGFTRNVGKGGICLEVINIEEGFEDLLRNKKVNLDLRLHIPLATRETKAIATIAWSKKIKSGYPNKYLIGLSFTEIDPAERKRIYFHARRLALMPKLIAVFILSLLAGLAYFYTLDYKLRMENRQLVEEIVKHSRDKSRLEKKILEYDKERKDIEKKVAKNQERVKEYESKIKELRSLATELKEKEALLAGLEKEREKTKKALKEATAEKQALLKKVTELSRESEFLKKRVDALSEKRVSAEEKLKQLISSFEGVEVKGVSNMYRWIKNHQNRITGLVVSYEGDRDLQDWAFTYDQSLVAQCFTLMGDQDNTRKVFDFYMRKAGKVHGAYANAYDAYTGSIVEYNVHAGPNIWLAIAVLKYTNRFKDETYLIMARDIADWLIALQGEDPEYGIRGGPEFAWYSTEHNLDAYAFFGMMYKITQDKRYLVSQERSFEWLVKNAFNKREGRMNRGKGDATIATDTFAWAIAAIGPGHLKKAGMEPDQIVDFAETNCVVTVDFKRPSGEIIEVTGFDFGKYAHLARGGVVSTEWTAQMVVTFKIMERYHRRLNNYYKAEYYKRKAEFYLSELNKMMITSPSKVGQGEGCLPYASQDNADTGHGWRAPLGSRTGSAAGTAYTIFATYNYNPLSLNNEDEK